MTTHATTKKTHASRELLAKLRACARSPSLITDAIVYDAVSAITAAATAAAPDEVAQYAMRDESAKFALGIFGQTRRNPGGAAHKTLVLLLGSPGDPAVATVLYNLVTLMPGDVMQRLTEDLDQSYRALTSADELGALKRPQRSGRPNLFQRLARA